MESGAGSQAPKPSSGAMRAGAPPQMPRIRSPAGSASSSSRISSRASSGTGSRTRRAARWPFGAVPSHLAQLLRARPRPPRLAAAEERGAHLLEEVLLLPRREAARDALPEVPPLGPALHGARVAQLGAEHAPEAAHA